MLDGLPPASNKGRVLRNRSSVISLICLAKALRVQIRLGVLDPLARIRPWRISCKEEIRLRGAEQTALPVEPETDRIGATAVEKIVILRQTIAKIESRDAAISKPSVWLIEAKCVPAWPMAAANVARSANNS